MRRKAAIALLAAVILAAWVVFALRPKIVIPPTTLDEAVVTEVRAALDEISRAYLQRVPYSLQTQIIASDGERILEETLLLTRVSATTRHVRMDQVDSWQSEHVAILADHRERQLLVTPSLAGVLPQPAELAEQLSALLWTCADLRLTRDSGDARISMRCPGEEFQEIVVDFREDTHLVTRLELGGAGGERPSTTRVVLSVGEPQPIAEPPTTDEAALRVGRAWVAAPPFQDYRVIDLAAEL